MEQLANKEIELIKDPKPDQRCSFCYSAVNNPLRYGDMYKYKNIMAHYFCVLMSSQLQQNGEDSEGFFGFLIKDLMKELDRAKSVKCCFCKRGGATAQCNIKVRHKQKCTNAFHFTCGITHGTLHYFFGKFQSLCHIHRRPQKIPEEFVKDSATQCWICHDIIQDVNSSSSSLWAACCKKSYFHKDCVQHQAYVSGEYHFKCPLCNNHEKFKQAMLRCGIFLPIRDAEWEREPNAYSDLYREHNSCDTEPCLCPHKGKDDDTRKYNSGAWDLIRCSTCGSEGTHRPCSGLPLKGDVTWNCGTCRQVLLKQQQSSSLPAPLQTESKNIEPDTCCADFCTCNKGREYRADKGMYRTVYCADCEYSWIHARCRNAQFQGVDRGEWICVGCELSDSEEADPPAAAPRAAIRGPSSDQPPLSVEETTKKQVSSPCHVVLTPMSSRYFYKSIAHKLSKGAYFKMLHREKLRLRAKEMNDSGCESFSRDESMMSIELNGTDNGESFGMSMLSLTAQSSKESNVANGLDETSELSLQLPIQKGYVYASQEESKSSSKRIVVTAETHEDPEGKLTGYVSSMFSSENQKICALTNCLRSLFSYVKEAKESDEGNAGIAPGASDRTVGNDEVKSSTEKKVVETVAEESEDANQSDIPVSNDKIDICNSKVDQTMAQDDLLDIAISDDKVNSSNQDKVDEAVSNTVVNCDKVSIDVQITNELSNSGISEMKENVDLSHTAQEMVGNAKNDIASIVNNDDINNENKTDELCKMCDSQELRIDTDSINGDPLRNSEVSDQSNNNVVDNFRNNNSSELKDSNVQNDIMYSCSTREVDLDSTVDTNVGICKTDVENNVESNTEKKGIINSKNTDSDLDSTVDSNADLCKTLVENNSELNNEETKNSKEDFFVGHSCKIKRVTRRHNPSLCSKRKCGIYKSHCNDVEYSDGSKECIKESKGESYPVVNGGENMDEQDSLEAKVAESKENIDEHKEKRQVNVLEIKFPLKHCNKNGISIIEPDETLLKRNELIIQYDTEVENHNSIIFKTKEEKTEKDNNMVSETKKENDFIIKNEVPMGDKPDMVITNVKEEPCLEENASYNVSIQKDDSENKLNKCKIEMNEISEGKNESMADNNDEKLEARRCKSNVKLNDNHKRRKYFNNTKNELGINSNSRFVSKRQRRPWNFVKSQKYTVVGKTKEVDVSGENQTETKTFDLTKILLNSSMLGKKDEVTNSSITNLVNTTSKKLNIEDQVNFIESNQKAHMKNKNIEMSADSLTEDGKVQSPDNDLDNQDILHTVDNTEDISRNNKTNTDSKTIDESIINTPRRKRKATEDQCQDVKRKMTMVVPETGAGDKGQSKNNTINEATMESKEIDSRQDVADRSKTHVIVVQSANKTPDDKKINLIAVKISDKQNKTFSAKKFTSRQSKTHENVDWSVNKTPDDKKINLIAVKSSDKQNKTFSAKKFTGRQSKTHENVDWSVNKTPDDKKINLIKVKSSDKQIKTVSSKKIYEYFTCTQTSMSLHDSSDSVANTSDRETKIKNTRHFGNIWLSTEKIGHSNIGHNFNDIEHNTSDTRPNTRNTRHNILNINERLKNTNERLAKKRSLSERKHEEPRTKRQRLSQLTNTPSKYSENFKDGDLFTKTNSNKKQAPWKRQSRSASKHNTTSRKIYEFFPVQNPVTPNAKLENDNATHDEADSMNEASEKMLVDDITPGVNKPNRNRKADDATVDDNSKQLESKETRSDKFTTSDVINKRTTSEESLSVECSITKVVMKEPPTSAITPGGTACFRSVRESTRRSSLLSILSNSDVKPSIPESREVRSMRRRSMMGSRQGDENFSPNKMATFANRTNESPCMKRVSRRLSVARKDLSLFL